MSFQNAMKAVYDRLNSGAYPVSAGIREATQGTPCIVFEVQNAELSVLQLFPATLANRKELWTITVEIACVADTVAYVAAMVDDLFEQLTGNPPAVSNTFSVILTGFSVSMTTETPDDGQSDAERIGTISATLQLSET